MSQRAVILLSLCVGILSQLTEDIHDVIRNDVMVDVHQRRNKDNYDNHGHATICGPPHVLANLSWYPKEPTIHEDTHFELNIIAPVGLSSGNLTGEIFIPEVKQNVFKFNYPFICEELKKYVKMTCPIQTSHNYSLQFVGGAGELPFGSFKVDGKIKNQQDELFLCFTLIITVTD